MSEINFNYADKVEELIIKQKSKLEKVKPELNQCSDEAAKKNTLEKIAEIAITHSALVYYKLHLNTIFDKRGV